MELEAHSTLIAPTEPREIRDANVLVPLPEEFCQDSISVEVSTLLGGSTYRETVNPFGLKNYRNTCYINAMLQILVRVEPLWKYLQAHKRQCRPSNVSHKCISCAMYEQAAGMRRGDDTGVSSPETAVVHVAMAALHGCLNPPPATDATCAAQRCPFTAPRGLNGEIQLDRGEQTDTWEFGNDLLEALATDESLTRCDMKAIHRAQYESGRSILREYIFGVVIRERMRCDGCGHCGDKIIQQWTLELDLNDAPPCARSLQDFMDHSSRHFRYNTPTRCFSMEGEMNPQCQKFEPDGSPVGTVKKQLFLEKEPPVLMMQLRRGLVDYRKNVSRKIFKEVQVPEQLNCLPTGPYLLRGIILHDGQGIHSGHYRAICWLRHNRMGQNVYGVFDDAKAVTPTTWDVVNSVEMRTNCVALLYVREQVPGVRDPTNGIGHGSYERCLLHGSEG